ncbi:Ig-like domain-containing protein, partial [Flectobacillus longus]|uniref:Ig-like domain-containing protein n=1 Tax=Flectobacillus longus TaxID=2984207 RepID=UPI0024B74697
MNVIYEYIKQKGTLVWLLGLWLVLAMSMVSHAQVRLSAGCSTGTADLSGLTAGNQPANTTLTWHSGTPATTVNKLSSISALTPGTYYAAFFDATNNCYSSGTLNVTVTAALCLNNVCPATSVNLNTAVSVSNLPANTVLTWHTSLPATTLNKIADPTVVEMSGTYYAAFFDATNNCYSGGGDAATEVLVEILPCTPVVLTNTCPSTTVNLNTAVSATNTPVGTTLTWHSGTPATTANKVANPTAIGTAGTYYAAFYDAAGDCYSPTASLNIVINECVEAKYDVATTLLNTAVSIPVLANDINSGAAAALTNVGLPTVSTNPAHGSTSVNADGSITYTPTSGYVGTDSFIYTLCAKNQTSVCDTALVMVSIGCPVLSSPTGAVASVSNICIGGSSTLSAACSSGVLTWYTDSGLTGTALASSTVSPTITTTYYGACVSGTCKSPASSVTVTVTATPLAPTSASASPSAICSGSSSVLSGTCATGTL